MRRRSRRSWYAGARACSSPRSPPTMTPPPCSGKSNGQTSVEQRFHCLKDPAFVDVVFVNKPVRIEALGYVMLLALFVQRYREVGPAVARVPRDHVPGGRATPDRAAYCACVPGDSGAQARRRPPLSGGAGGPPPHVARILEALGFSEMIYTTIPARFVYDRIGCGFIWPSLSKTNWSLTHLTGQGRSVPPHRAIRWPRSPCGGVFRWATVALVENDM